jgi:hypothetical protein
MLRHLVFLGIHNSSEAIVSIRDHLEVLSQKMPGCKRFHFGECLDDKLSHYFFMDFENEVCRDAYVHHPEHIKIAEQIIIPRLKEGIKSVVIFDYEYLNTKKISPMSKGTTGYLFIKNEEISDSLANLAIFCDKIERLKPLQNCSKEALGKEYPYALKIEIKSGNEPIRLSKSSFWIASRNQSTQASSLSPPPLKSRL